MTTSEFSNEFDVLYNNITSNQAPGLDNYEKSVVLTKAQEEVVLGLYSGTSGFSFEETEYLRRCLDSLIETTTLKPTSLEEIKIYQSSTLFQLPTDKTKECWFITYEQATLNNNKLVKVIPVRLDEWNVVKDNPFKKQNKNKVIRIDSGNNIIELISDLPVSEYKIKYLRKPSPIILETITTGEKINGESEEKPCELNTVLHRLILDRAVQLAANIFKQQAGSN